MQGFSDFKSLFRTTINTLLKRHDASEIGPPRSKYVDIGPIIIEDT